MSEAVAVAHPKPHAATVKVVGSPDYGHAYFTCSCGKVGTPYSRRFAEARRLAQRDAEAHARPSALSDPSA